MDPLSLKKQLLDNSFDLDQYTMDVKKWGAEMKEKEKLLKKNKENTENQEYEDILPQKKDVKKKKPKKVKVDTNRSENGNNIATDKHVNNKIPKDYNYWANFDADAECEKVDESVKEDSDSAELTDEMDDEVMELAIKEKDRGNEFFKNNNFDDAIRTYTKAIALYAYEPAFYCNRALCHLKCEQYKSAESDCTIALQLDNTSVKAYHRRAVAREALGQYTEAKADLNKVFEFDSKNKASVELMSKIERKLCLGQDHPIMDTQRPVSKFTMSRKKTKPVVDYQIPSTSKQYVEPVFNRVYERKQEPTQNLATKKFEHINGTEMPIRSKSTDFINNDKKHPTITDTSITVAAPISPPVRSKSVEILNNDEKHPKIKEIPSKEIMKTDENDPKIKEMPLKEIIKNDEKDPKIKEMPPKEIMKNHEKDPKIIEILPAVVKSMENTEHASTEIPQNVDKTLPSSNIEAAPPNKTNHTCTSKDSTQWPSGQNVEIENVVNKLPNQRSKQRLKRCQIYDVDLSSNISQLLVETKKVAELATEKRTVKMKTNKNTVLKLIENNDTSNDDIYLKTAEGEFENKFESLNCNVDLTNEDFSKLNMPIPTTSLQFYLKWKTLKDNQELRFLYLRQINPTSYADIFKDSLETKVFSEIIQVLSTSFIEKSVDVFPYLHGLTKVKRFSAMVMFKTSKDKEGLVALMFYMFMKRKEYGWPEEVIDYLTKKYEL